MCKEYFYKQKTVSPVENIFLTNILMVYLEFYDQLIDKKFSNLILLKLILQYVEFVFSPY
jgi:hypothetical protein